MNNQTSANIFLRLWWVAHGLWSTSCWLCSVGTQLLATAALPGGLPGPTLLVLKSVFARLKGPLNAHDSKHQVQYPRQSPCTSPDSIPCSSSLLAFSPSSSSHNGFLSPQFMCPAGPAVPTVFCSMQILRRKEEWARSLLVVYGCLRRIAASRLSAQYPEKHAPYFICLGLLPERANMFDGAAHRCVNKQARYISKLTHSDEDLET